MAEVCCNRSGGAVSVEARPFTELVAGVARAADFTALRRNFDDRMARLELETDGVEHALRRLIAAGRVYKITAEFELRLRNAEKNLEFVLGNDDLKPVLDVGRFADLRQTEQIERAYKEAIARCAERPAGHWLQENFDRAALLGVYCDRNRLLDASRRRDLADDVIGELKQGAFIEQAVEELEDHPTLMDLQTPDACTGRRAKGLDSRSTGAPGDYLPYQFELDLVDRHRAEAGRRDPTLVNKQDLRATIDRAARAAADRRAQKQRRLVKECGIMLPDGFQNEIGRK
jgi:hypothetical protein